MPMKYRGSTTKQGQQSEWSITDFVNNEKCFIGIDADLYTPIDTFFSDVEEEPRNKCYCPGDEYCPPKGLQNISPCQYSKYQC